MAFRKKRKDPFKEIQSCLQKRDYKGALDWFNTLLRKDPKNTQIRLRFADTLVLAGSKREAVKQLRVVADELADKVDRGEDISRFFTNEGRMVRPARRVNVDFREDMVLELDELAMQLNVSRQAVIKTLVRQGLDQRYLAEQGRREVSS